MRPVLVSLFARGLALGLAFGLARPAMAKPNAQARTTRPGKPHNRVVTPARPRFPAVQLFGAHVGEALAYQPRDERGRVRRDAQRALERLLRCRQTGQRHRLHPRLGEALYQIGRHFAGHRVSIYSGFRPRAYCTRAHSRHMTGSAIDFHVEGVSNEALIAYLRKAFHPAGVGYYPHGVHVHLDLERSVDTYWVDAGPPPTPPAAAVATPMPTTDEAPAPRDTAPLSPEAPSTVDGELEPETVPEALPSPTPEPAAAVDDSPTPEAGEADEGSEEQ